MTLTIPEIEAGFAAADAEVSRLRVTPGVKTFKEARAVIEAARGQREKWRSRLNRARTKAKPAH